MAAEAAGASFRRLLALAVIPAVSMAAVQEYVQMGAC
jgi:hypothetical protein